MVRPVLSVLTAATLALVPVHAVAQVPEATAQDLYDEGRSLYETADYDAAIEKWTKAYGMLGNDPELAEVKTGLLYNLASAHEEAYEIDRDVRHLSKAKALLERFRDNLDLLYEGDAAKTERERVAARIAAVEEQIEAARASSDPEPQTEPQTEPQPQPEPEPQQVDTAPENPGQPLVIAGAVGLGLGAAMLGVGVVAGVMAGSANDFSEQAQGDSAESLQTRRDEIAFGETMNALTVAGYVTGGVFAIAGGVMLGVGLAKNARAQNDVTVSPSIGPTFAGLQVGGRF